MFLWVITTDLYFILYIVRYTLSICILYIGFIIHLITRMEWELYAHPIELYLGYFLLLRRWLYLEYLIDSVILLSSLQQCLRLLFPWGIPDGSVTRTFVSSFKIQM